MFGKQEINEFFAKNEKLKENLLTKKKNKNFEKIVSLLLPLTEEEILLYYKLLKIIRNKGDPRKGNIINIIDIVKKKKMYENEERQNEENISKFLLREN